MKKYAICPQVIENNSSNWILQPFIRAGAKTFNTVQEIPNDYILISVHHPPWRSPYKEWIEKGNKHIEIDYGYWGLNIPRRNTRRVTFGGSHNLNMRDVPYSRLKTLDPKVEDWKQKRGNQILVIEPQQGIILERTGVPLETWKKNMLDTIQEFWDGPVKFRRKAGGKNPARWPTFLEDLQASTGVIGERTMACVEAVILGYPAYTVDYSAVSLIMGTDIKKILNPEFPDRTKWLEHIAWSQFTPEEFSNGTFVVDCLEQYQII